ncbi:MAG: hypothetical protein II165_02465, partial [Bacteroidales bacterium]|nr:hypothetical protein [Bacteroidales bacterium]
MLRLLITTALIVLTCCNCLAQWTMRPSFYNVADVCALGDKAVAFCPHAVFVADYSGDVQIYTKTTLLSGADITAGYADPDGKSFITAFADGKADRIVGNSVSSIADISAGNYLYNRRITHITSSNDYYIFSGEFGISFVKKDFSSVYGVCRTDKPVIMCAVNGNTLWAVTEDEILSTNLANVNLQSPDIYTKYDFSIPSGYAISG